MGSKAPFPYRIVFLVSLGWLSIAFPRMLISPLLPTIEAEFSVSHAQAALLMSSYLLPYAIMQMPAGSLSDRFGNRPFMILAMLGTSIGSLLIGFTTDFNQALVVRSFAGAMSGLWFTTSSKVVAQLTTSSRQGRALGITYSGGAIANVLIYVTVGVAANGGTGWRYLFMLGSIPGFVCLALTYLLTKNLKEGGGGKDEGEENLNRGVFMKYLKSRTMILALSFNFLASLAGWSLIAFIPTYLVLDRGLLVAEASAFMIVQAVTSIFNNYIGGYVTDRTGLRLPVLVSVTTMCVVTFLFPLLPVGVPLGILLLAWGLVGGWSFIAFNLFVLQAFPKKLRGTFLGLYNQVGFISATVGPPIFGLVIDVAGFKSFFALALAIYLAALPTVVLIREHRHEENAMNLAQVAVERQRTPTS